MTEWKTHLAFRNNQQEWVSVCMENDTIIWAAIIPKENHWIFRLIEYTDKETAIRLKLQYYGDTIELVYI